MPPDRPRPDDWEDVSAPAGASTSSSQRGSLRAWMRPAAAAPTSSYAPAPPPQPAAPSSSTPPPPPSLLRSLFRRLHEAGLALVTGTANALQALTRRIEPWLPPPQHRAAALVSAALLALAARHIRALRTLRARDRECRALTAALAGLHRAVLSSSGNGGAGGAASSSAPLHPLLEAAGYSKAGLAAAGGSGANALAAVVLSEVVQAAAG